VPGTYRVVCGYTHLGADKLQLTTMTGRKLSSSDENIRIFFKKEIVEKSVLSYIACAYTSAELLCLTGGSLAAVAEVTKPWNMLLEASLVAKIFWNIRSKQLLPLTTF
jgi:hypothetical protein